ncbi:putative baseplate assembly protein [Arthrobacter sp. VKM Ac-2550]|uniref:putative baseplate assembly protein n=1 Tax=Crystallibacter permensis TaxID=1938888 RepID=UPI002225E494|nr:putative baseplate assembly protein [Arthrobacter sp. VKM Ac-2550]MCW2131618.1 putative baseplate assembly protein [Arthrobacter sp. VKM Ac-2550]
MSIPVPNLDDRSFMELVASARERIRQVDPSWEPTVHDPGMVLVEAFAHLTDMLLYRLNRVPEKLYTVYLNLLGTSLRPPHAARTLLEFTRQEPDGGPLTIPKGTQAGCPPGIPGAPQPVFSTIEDAVLEAGQAIVRVAAVDATLHEAVPVGTGTGRPGQVLQLPAAPAVAGEGLAVGVEVPAGARLRSGNAVLVDGVAYRTCRDVQAFADAGPGESAVRVDRFSGTLVFPWWPEGDAQPPPAPAAGARIIAWFRSGGGAQGNVPAGSLTVLRTPLDGLTCTNPEPATGGRDAEPLSEALRRAPQDFQARDRAVTARDYESLAARHGGVGRVRAITRREIWEFANPGEVEVVLVPHVPETDRRDGSVTEDQLRSYARDQVVEEVAAHLRERATIGAVPVVRFARSKQVLVRARVHVRPDEDAAGVQRRILQRLHSAINPLPEGGTGYGSGFGNPLRVSNLYRVMEEAEPGVEYVDRVQLEVEQVPDQDAVSLVRAAGRPGSWFVAGGDTLFRTLNWGRGWEACADFDGETIRVVVPYPEPGPGRTAAAFPGKVAVATTTDRGSRIYLSDDLGESWRRAAELGFAIADLSWVSRAGRPVLLMAGARGLYELPDEPGAGPVQNVVDPTDPDRGFYTVDAFMDVRGQTGVVLAAEAAAGIWLSPRDGAPESFHRIKTKGDDVRCMAIQYDGPATWLWLGRAVPEGSGAGCARLKLVELDRTRFDEALAASWEELTDGWSGGSCSSLHILGSTAYAATYSSGVIALDLSGGGSWDHREVNCGLPLRDRARFEPVESVSGAIDDDGGQLVLAAGPRGIFGSDDAAQLWHSRSRRVVDDVVTLPDTWLFCSGDHQIEVVHSDG